MNYLSGNIRYLRKHRKLSQQHLADDLGVKRSNIAAYETKNVEPRLSLIDAIARYFGVPLQDLVTRDLSTAADAFGTGAAPTTLSYSALRDLRELSAKIQRMLDGFKVFYEFKLSNQVDDEDPASRGDIDNFLVFINHMLEYNRMIESSLKMNATAGKYAGDGRSFEDSDDEGWVAAE